LPCNATNSGWIFDSIGPDQVGGAALSSKVAGRCQAPPLARVGPRVQECVAGSVVALGRPIPQIFLRQKPASFTLLGCPLIVLIGRLPVNVESP